MDEGRGIYSVAMFQKKAADWLLFSMKSPFGGMKYCFVM